MAGDSLAGMDERGRHFDTSTLLLSSTFTPPVAIGVDRDCDGVVGGVVDFLGSKGDATEVDVVDVTGALEFQPKYEPPSEAFTAGTS